MIRKILSPVNQAITHVQDWADEKLRHLCGHMTPEIRLAVILLMLLFFGGLSIYCKHSINSPFHSKNVILLL